MLVNPLSFLFLIAAPLAAVANPIPDAEANAEAEPFFWPTPTPVCGTVTSTCLR